MTPILSLGTFEISDSDADPIPILDEEEPEPIVPLAGPSHCLPRRQAKEKVVGRKGELAQKKAYKTPLFIPSDDEREPLALIPFPREDNEEALAPDLGAVFPVDPDPQPHSTPQPEPEVDPLEACSSQVLDVVPDVCPEFLATSIAKQIALSPDSLVERVLHSLFEDPSYPRIDPRKRKLKELQDIRDGESNVHGDKKRAKVDYLDEHREFTASPMYFRLALVCNPFDRSILSVSNLFCV